MFKRQIIPQPGEDVFRLCPEHVPPCGELDAVLGGLLITPQLLVQLLDQPLILEHLLRDLQSLHLFPDLFHRLESLPPVVFCKSKLCDQAAPPLCEIIGEQRRRSVGLELFEKFFAPGH